LTSGTFEPVGECLRGLAVGVRGLLAGCGLVLLLLALAGRLRVGLLAATLPAQVPGPVTNSSLLRVVGSRWTLGRTPDTQSAVVVDVALGRVLTGVLAVLAGTVRISWFSSLKFGSAPTLVRHVVNHVTRVLAFRLLGMEG